MYEAILVPLDGSKRAERILPFVEELAQSFKSTVILLRVVGAEVEKYGTHGHTADFYLETFGRALDEAKDYLSALQGELTRKGIRVRTIVEEGPIVNNIIHIAESEKVSLVAMASHGRTGVRRAFYGSVASGVLHSIDRPLLLVRADDGG